MLFKIVVGSIHSIIWKLLQLAFYSGMIGGSTLTAGPLRFFQRLNIAENLRSCIGLRLLLQTHRPDHLYKMPGTACFLGRLNH